MFRYLINLWKRLFSSPVAIVEVKAPIKPIIGLTRGPESLPKAKCPHKDTVAFYTTRGPVKQCVRCHREVK